MDGYREHPGGFDLSSASVAAAPDVAAAEEVAAAIGTDERRMHVRAYNYWVSLLEGRDYPSIEDLEPANLDDFAANSVLLDFTAGRDNPATAYIGAAIREECGLGDKVATIADIPSRSLLSRLTDHYLQIIANRAPVGFEAEFVNQRGAPICYRGILMPFSSDGDTIDFIYGVINWKRAEARAETPIVPAAAATEPEPEAAPGLAGAFEAEPDAPATRADDPIKVDSEIAVPEIVMPEIALAMAPASPTGCARPARPPRRSSRPTAEAAPRSTRRSAGPMISRSPPGATRRNLPSCSRNRGSRRRRARR